MGERRQRNRREIGGRLVLLAVLGMGISIAIGVRSDVSAQVDDGVVRPIEVESKSVDQNSLPPSITAELAGDGPARFADVDANALRDALDQPTSSLELFDGVIAELVPTDRRTDAYGAHTVIGKTAEGAPFSITIRDGAITADVTVGDRRLRVIHISESLHLIHELTSDRLQRTPAAARRAFAPAPAIDVLPDGFTRHVVDHLTGEDVVTTVGVPPGLDPIAPTGTIPAPTTALQAGPSTSMIDVMIWYDDLALGWFGTTAAAENSIIASVAAGNSALAASGVDAMLVLVELDHVVYTGSGNSSVDLDRLQQKYDGFLDDAHATRNSTDSDLVALITHLTDNTCGRGDLLQTLPSVVTIDQAFSVVSANCLATDTYAHEVGHNLGAAHDDANTFGSDGVFAYSRGWVDATNQFVTLMSYPNTASGCSGCTAINQFSSATELYMTFPTGDIDHDNAITLEQTRMGVEAYRPHPCPPPSNDDYPVRVALVSESLVTVAGTNVCATVENLESFFIGDEPVESVWYEWTALAPGTATISTCSSLTNFDTTLTIYDDNANFGGLTVLGYNDDASGSCAIDPSHSEAIVAVAAGQTLRFKVDGAAASTGSFELTVSLAALCDGLPVTVYLDRAETPTQGDDVVLGTDDADLFDALGGDDTVCLLGGDDVLNAGSGDDTVFAGDGLDIVYGLAGNDEIHGGDGADELLGFDGLDSIWGDADDDFINGGSDSDMLWGGLGNDSIFGQAGSDTINGEDGDDLLNGVGGDDVINGGAGMDLINGGPGADTIDAGPDADTVFGLTGDDPQLHGGAGDDLVYGQLGVDVIDGGPGADFLWGNDGDDTITDPSGLNVINAGPGNDTVTGGADADDIFGDGTLAQAGNDLLDGGAGSDRIWGFAGDDVIVAADGEADEINAGPHVLADTCIVDLGLDTVYNCP